MSRHWQYGDIITRREVLGFEPTGTVDSTAAWFGKAWLELPARVVVDTPEELVLYVPPGAPFTFPDEQWPIEGGKHPWIERPGWQGEGCLMLHRPGEHHAVWHFWDEPDRTFANWYINVQTDFGRTVTTFETQDLELDFVVAPDHSWQVKDWDDVTTRVTEGRYSPELADWIHDYGRGLITRLETEGLWWELSWANWTPPSAWG